MKFLRILILLALGLLISTSQAQETIASALDEPTVKSATFLEILHSAGFMLYPLAALSVAAVFLIIFYLLTIRQGAVVSDKFMNAADALIRKQDYLGLLAICNRHNEAIARITEKTLDFATKNPTATFEEVREVTGAEGSRQSSLLYQRITYLAVIGSIAPMVGLLGTVIGMIKSFRAIGGIKVAADMQTALAGGVSEALLTTAAGLIIGIPAMIFYSLFSGRVQRLISEMEAATTHLLALLAAQYKRSVSPMPTQLGRPVSQSQPVSPYPTDLEPDYFSEYSIRDRTIDPQGL